MSRLGICLCRCHVALGMSRAFFLSLCFAFVFLAVLWGLGAVATVVGFAENDARCGAGGFCGP